MEGVGFEPTKARAGRFTVCSLWPLGYPSARSPSFVCLPQFWLAVPLSNSSRGRRGDSNPGPTDYKSVALPTELHRQTPYLQQVGLDDDAGTGSRTTTLLTAKRPNYSPLTQEGGTAGVARTTARWRRPSTPGPSRRGPAQRPTPGGRAHNLRRRRRNARPSAWASRAAETPHRGGRRRPPRH
jgi:hypothetical protein